MKKIFRFLGIALLALCLTFAWESDAIAQFPFLPRANNTKNPETPWWDLNRARICGSNWCSNVELSGNMRIGTDLIIAAPRELKSDDYSTALSLEKRARLIEQLFAQIVRNVTRSQPLPQVARQDNWDFWWPYSSKKPLHPLTPKFEIGTQNKQTVIFTPAQSELGIPQATFITVNRADAIANGTTVKALATTWQERIELAISRALWGREFDAQFPWTRANIAIIIGGLAMILIVLLAEFRHLLSRWHERIAKKLNGLILSQQFNPEAASGETIPESDVGETEPTDSGGPMAATDTPTESPEKKYNFSFGFQQPIADFPKLIATQFYSQTALRQEKNLVELLRRFILFGVLFILLVSLIAVGFLFRQTRPFTIQIAIQAFVISTLWIGIAVMDKLLDFAIDSALNDWAKEKQKVDPNSNRYAMRASTYSPALKNGTMAISIALGAYGTIILLGINPAILAGAGAFALLTAFLSRNLVENMLNGILILCTDRYALGDVVQIGEYIGAVESMNLYVTNLRNLDGQSIAIPNGKISTVINNTKDWSRVNFGLTISLNADIRKAMEIIRDVSQTMQSEPEWKDKILEPVDILGVDEISHQGIVIRFLIKTSPSQQWAVGRTFRFRLKTALDRAGISLGIPQQSIWYYQDSSHPLISLQKQDSQKTQEKNFKNDGPQS